MSNHLTTQQLIAKIETADKRYRRSSTVLLIIIGFAIAATLVLQYQALEQFRAQSAERAAGLKALSEAQKAESEKSNRYLQCIARYFADPNRRETIITDIESCNIDLATGAFIPGTDNDPLATSGSDTVNLSPGPAATGPNNSNTGDPGAGQNNGGTSGSGGDTPPPRNFIQRNITDPLVNGTVDLINGARGIIGL